MELLTPRSTPKQEDHPLSVVRDCLFNIFAATLHIGGRSSIRNFRTRVTVVTGTHLSRINIEPKLIQSVFCLTTGPKPPLKRFLHIVRSRASSFKREYPFLSLRSYSSFLRLLPHLLVTSISPFIFPSITCFRRQFLRKM